MTTVEAYSDLLRMGKQILTTRDASLRLNLSISGATRAMTRLQAAGLARRIFRGLWAVDFSIDPLTIPEHLTAPFPAYVSLQSALFLHGMIGQIPQVTFVASLGPTRRVRTSMGTFSIHRLAPEYFGGYETAAGTGVRLATPEKALMDVLYLGNARSRLFASLPELTLPERFSEKEARRWIERIRDTSRRTMVRARLGAILERAACAERRGRRSRRRLARRRSRGA
jgi:predicted transcriptional regulator of viral defense system